LATVETAEDKTCDTEMKIQMVVPQLRVRKDAMDLRTKKRVKVYWIRVYVRRAQQIYSN